MNKYYSKITVITYRRKIAFNIAFKIAFNNKYNNE